MSIPNLILASSSPRRQELMRGLGLQFRVVVSRKDEIVEEGMPPERVVQVLARQKATEVAGRIFQENPNTKSIIIGADTIVVLDGEILGKPENPQHAIDMLRRMQGRTHIVYTGVCITERPTGREEVAYSSTVVRMKPLSDEVIKRYVATGEPLDKAGSYGIQGLGATLVRSIDGDYFTVVGFPVGLVSDLLEVFGVYVV